MGTNVKAKHRTDDIKSHIVFWMITIMHDNPLLSILRNPYKVLKAAGLKPGQKVLEVGCGPGFFTLPAARIVGDEGTIYAIDTNPFAIERVKKKIAREKRQNIQPILGNASDTGLPNQSVDLAFFFGLPHIQGGLGNVLTEMRRILRPEGTIAFAKSRGSLDNLIKEIEREGFKCSDRKARILVFKKVTG